MTCYHPNKGFVVGINSNGKKDMKFCSHRVEFIWSYDSTFTSFYRSDVTVYENPKIDSDCLEIYDDFLLVDRSCRPIPKYVCVKSVHLPCGQCIGCRIDKSKEWANRMVMESTYYPTNCFLTLTYDDKNVPKASYLASDGVSEKKALTLRKDDFQRFIKRLRDAVSVYDDDGKVLDESKIRFYACGEYGTTTQRPHYHAIIFNWFPPDARYHHHDSRGYNFYTSELLSKLWKDGFHLVSNISWETCAYTARYVTKKLGNKDSDFYDTFNIEPEFCLMSRKPGLARRYFDDHKSDIYEGDETYIIRLSDGNSSLRFKPPRYFDSLFDIEQPETLAEIKEIQQQMAKDIIDLKLSKTDLNYYELLAVEEENFKNRVKALKRL